MRKASAQKSLIALIQIAFLVALEIVLNRFCSINTQFIKIGFSFIPIALCGIMFGPIPAAIAGGLADFLGAILFPIGPYFPGFTLTAALYGLVFGLFLHRREMRFFPNVLLAAGLYSLGLSLFLNTLWLNILYSSPYFPLLVTRIVQSAILLALQLAVIPLLYKIAALVTRLEARHDTM